MHYYRYRPASELSIKELLYDEIYFGSTKENNDPYDGKPFYFFSKDTGKWFRLFECAWSQVKHIDCTEWAKSLSTILAEYSPMTFNAALKFDYMNALLTIPNPPNNLYAFGLSGLIKQYINLYKPVDSYFASFSKTCNNHLMWAHYASMYQGYCLIFKSIDGRLRQCPQRMRKSITRSTKHGLAPNMSWGLPESLAFEDVRYSKSVSCGDAFLRFPQHVSACSLNEKERIELVESQKAQYLEKHESWSYEQESRLLLMPPIPWLFGEHVSLTKQERLFHYQPTQLVGIVFGPRMQNDFKQRIYEIVYNRMERRDLIPNGIKTELFDFIIFETRLSEETRDIIVEPIQILSLTNKKNITDKGFNEQYKSWIDDWAIVFDGKSGGSKKQII